MTVLLSGKIVKTVGEMQVLRITKPFTKFFNTTVYITKVQVNFLYSLSVHGCAETQHTVSGGVLRTDVYHEILRLEYCKFFFYYTSVGFFNVAHGSVLHRFMVEAHRIDVGRIVVVLTQRISHPIVSQEQTSHIGMVDELDPEIVIDLTLIKISHRPKVGNRVEHGIFAVVGSDFHRHMSVMHGRCEIVHTPESLGPIHTDQCHEIIKVQFRILFQRLGKAVPLAVGDTHRQPLPILKYCIREQ